MGFTVHTMICVAHPGGTCREVLCPPVGELDISEGMVITEAGNGVYGGKDRLSNKF